MTLREICQRYDSKIYHQHWQTSQLMAGFYNANGGIDGRNRPAWFTDFHPEHASDKEPDTDDIAAMEMLISRASVALDLVDVSNDSGSD